MIRIMRTRTLERLQAALELARGAAAENARRAAEQSVALRLIEQARAHAEAREVYWRTRAELFMDQVALKAGIIATPTMTEPSPPPSDQVQAVFSAMGVSEINTKAGPSSSRGSLPITGVDGAEAAAAVADVLRRT